MDDRAAPANDSQPAADPAVPQISAADMLNHFSQEIARQATRLMNAGIDPDWFVTMYLDHAAGIIALVEPKAKREQVHRVAREKLDTFVHKKTIQRRRHDRTLGIPAGASGLRLH